MASDAVRYAPVCRLLVVHTTTAHVLLHPLRSRHRQPVALAAAAAATAVTRRPPTVRASVGWQWLARSVWSASLMHTRQLANCPVSVSNSEQVCVVVASTPSAACHDELAAI